jgi:hypothetical protein
MAIQSLRDNYIIFKLLIKTIWWIVKKKIKKFFYEKLNDCIY